MSMMMAHIRYGRALAKALHDEAENAASTPQIAEMLHLIADAHEAASVALDHEERAESAPPAEG